ncbi:N-6 DNA methylase [Prosthecobacter sp.]|uniref:N-6 DNA methylase n=1 Tax=Prosthecobacter sp. TaxID=1965333 RepID=UPI00378426C9
MSLKTLPKPSAKTKLRARHVTGAASQSLDEIMAPWGCPKLIPLDRKFQLPEQIDYLDLLPKKDSDHGSGLHAVAAHRSAALLYVVDASRSSRKPNEAAIKEMRRTLANRSDSAWLGIVNAGTLTLYPVGFGDELPAAKTLNEKDPDAPLFFQSLVQGTFEAPSKPQACDHVYQEIKKLLTRTTTAFVGNAQVEPLHVLSMAGRALFFRFLIDRNIVRPAELSTICPAALEDGLTLRDVFSNSERAAQTSLWLDETFNGDFLPLIADKLKDDERLEAYRRFYRIAGKATEKAVFKHLEAILKGWEQVEGKQLAFDWHRLDFAHIPVGVLSEVYEDFSHQVDSKLSRDTSVHYTPRFIANFMVEEAFASLPGNKSLARVLDPASGAGVFLVLAFRRLFRERYQINGARPDTREIQSILYDQIRGFDVSESALRLAALALYITAIELNASPHPPKALKFPRNLRKSVLHHFGEEAAAEVYANDPDTATFQAMLGSLGELPVKAAQEDFKGAFDLVIGNPPWTRLRDEAPEERRNKTGDAGSVKKSATARANAAFTQIGRETLEARELTHLIKEYENPDKAPDIPFLWRATQWARPEGIIAFALHGRLFLHTQGKKDISWHAVQEAMAITGIVNGADLRWTKVWDGMHVPFCLFFARNEKSRPEEGFFYASPLSEYAINSCSRFRIDYAAVRAITQAETRQRPWLLKTLSLGNTLDVDVMDRITKAFPQTLLQYWEQFDPEGIRTGQGYNISPGLRQKPAPFLGSLLDFSDPSENGFAVEWEALNTFESNHKRSSAYRPKEPEQYQPPLVIVPKAPGDNIYTPKSWLTDRPVAFSQSYYGYACKDSPAPEHVAAMIHVLAHSTLARYFIVMSSSSLGSDFMMFLKADFDALPFPDVAKLPAADKKILLKLSARLQEGEGHMPAPEPEKKARRGKKQEEDLPDLFKTAPAPAPASVKADKQREKALAFWAELNAFIFRLYGLGVDDAQVIEDTLFASAAYRLAGKDAFLPIEPQPGEDGLLVRDVFCDELQQRLQPFFAVMDETVQVGEPPGLRQQTWNTTWRFVAVWTGQPPANFPARVLQEAMQLANERGLSRIIVRVPRHHCLLIGILNARRWWTRTRARLCAHTITMEHLAAFEPPHSSHRPAPLPFRRKRVVRH